MQKKAQEIYDQIPKEEVETYFDATKVKRLAWMINWSDRKYILDNYLYQ